MMIRDVFIKFMKFMILELGVLVLRWGFIGYILNICIIFLKILSVFVKIRKVVRKYFYFIDICF